MDFGVLKSLCKALRLIPDCGRELPECAIARLGGGRTKLPAKIEWQIEVAASKAGRVEAGAGKLDPARHIRYRAYLLELGVIQKGTELKLVPRSISPEGLKTGKRISWLAIIASLPTAVSV